MGEVKDRQWSIFNNLNKFFTPVRVCLVVGSQSFQSVLMLTERLIKNPYSVIFFKSTNENRD